MICIAPRSGTESGRKSVRLSKYKCFELSMESNRDSMSHSHATMSGGKLFQTEHQQWFGLQQLHTATGRHPADGSMVTADVVWT